MEVIEIDIFNTVSVKQAVKRLEECKDECDNFLRDVIRELGNDGVDIVRQEIVRLGKIDSGEIFSSVEAEFSDDGKSVVIRVGAYYAVFVEFGTGIAGSLNPHPAPPETWELGKASYSNGKPWVYYKNGRFYSTYGQAHSPFFYNAMKEIKSRVEAMK